MCNDSDQELLHYIFYFMSQFKSILYPTAGLRQFMRRRTVLFGPMAGSSVLLIPPRPQPLAAIAHWLYPQPTLKGLGDRLLFQFRIYKNGEPARAWLAWLGRPHLAPLARANPALYKKIIRPYMTPAWDAEHKLGVLIGHYEFMLHRIGGAGLARIFQARGVPLLDYVTDHGQHYTVHLGYDQRFNKEGELSLTLWSATYSRRIASLALIIRRSPQGGHGLLIGCMQGMPAGSDKDIIKEVAKTLHGLRPKALLLFVAQELAKSWGLATIEGISDRLHISNHSDYCLNRTRRPKLAYDEFWLESGGRRTANGFYELPLQHHERGLAEIKPNKRSLYRQRYAMLATLRPMITHALADLDQAGPVIGSLRRNPIETAPLEFPRVRAVG